MQRWLISVILVLNCLSKIFYYTDAYFNQFIVYDLDTCKYEIGLRSIVYFDIHLR